ncbi:hypothetical protein GCM10014715_09420 [Streptomyces spiralis]|uniref:Isoamylase C-terminal domain-containing protein n=2 Tax=Streptomyces spiralis TaxID=66376 RepID=A0A919DLZ8_9ACTN|nr:hypothetical protein GCM10014715_09420 [Streptomyces spiralis]
MGRLQWFTPAGSAPDTTYWSDPGNHALAWRIDGTEFSDPSSALYVGYNGWSGDVDFTLPSPGPACAARASPCATSRAARCSAVPP